MPPDGKALAKSEVRANVPDVVGKAIVWSLPPVFTTTSSVPSSEPLVGSVILPCIFAKLSLFEALSSPLKSICPIISLAAGVALSLVRVIVGAAAAPASVDVNVRESVAVIAPPEVTLIT